MTDEHLVQKTNASVRHGKIMMIVSFASILFWILLSEGYRADLNVIANIFYTLEVEFFEICPRQTETFQLPCTALFSFMTKNLILLSFLVGTYGVLIWQGLTTSPVLYLQAYIAKKKERNHAIASAQIPIPTNRAEEKQVLPESSNSKEDFVVKIIMAIGGAMFFLIFWIFLGSVSSKP